MVIKSLNTFHTDLVLTIFERARGVCKRNSLSTNVLRSVYELR